MKNYALGFITAILLAYSSYMLVTPTHAASEPILITIEKNFGRSGKTNYYILVDGNVTCYTLNSLNNISCVNVDR